MAHTEGELRIKDATVYQLMHAGWRKGVEQFKNRFSFRVYADKEAGVTDEEIARRLAACWNACHDMSTEDVEELVSLDHGVMRLVVLADDLRKERDELAASLKAVLKYADARTCPHEDTYRGGAIWEICNSCGAKWADDEGGKPEWSEPEELEQARAILSRYQEEE